jgi:hypothetical protein
MNERATNQDSGVSPILAKHDLGLQWPVAPGDECALASTTGTAPLTTAVIRL